MVREQPVNPTAQQSLGKLEGKTPLVVFLVLALAIGAVGYVIFAHLNEAIRQDKYHDLSAVGDLKVGQIVGWLDERRGDGAATTRDPILAQEVQRWLQRAAPQDEAARRIESRLQGLREAYSYDKVILLDRSTRPVIVAGDAFHQYSHAESNQRAAEAMNAGQPLLSDLHLESETDGAPARANIDLYAPLLDAGRRVISAIYFQIDPYRFLFPFIQSWPTTSRSAETLLVRRDGDDVLYLNELRHRKDSALRFRLPLNTPDLPAAKSLRGETGVIQGVDYRDIPVLAALRTIPGTSWHLVAKIDQAEVFAPTRDLAIGVGAMVAVLIAGAGLLVALWWRRQHAQFLAMHFKDQFERQALVQHFDYLNRFANDIILLVNEDRRIVEANDTAVKAYGYPREQLLQMHSIDLRANEARESFEDDRQKAAALGSRKYETVHQRSDGSTFPVEANVRVIVAEGKQYRQAIIRDISERKHAENALHESEAKFRGISHAAQDAIILLDPAGSVRYWNPAAERIFDYAESEILGKNMHRLLAPQRYQEEAQRGFAQFSKTGTGRYVGRTVELTGLRKDGTEFPVEVSFSGFEKAGAWHAVGIVRDVTERKRAEEALRDSEWRFRQLAENISEAFWFLSFKPEQLVFVNPAFTRIWGIAEQDIRYRPRILMESVHPDDKDKVLRAFESWRAKGSAEGYELQYRIARPDGTIRWVCNHVAGVMDDRGGLWGACGVIEDITERKRAEDEIRALNATLERRVAERTAQLEAANKELESFSYSVSHDLRAPLRAVDGFARILEEGHSEKLDGEGRRLLRVVRESTQRMGELIDGLLKFSRTGRGAVAATAIDMEALVRSALQEMSAPAADPRLRIEIGPLPAALGDPALIKQVWINLLSNAIKFSNKRDDAQIEVNGSSDAREHVYRVKDNGAGFDMQYYEKLFGVFQRLHSAEEFAGTGVGLAIVQRVVTRHGGRVWAEGKVNAGATFYFALPKGGEA